MNIEVYNKIYEEGIRNEELIIFLSNDDVQEKLENFLNELYEKISLAIPEETYRDFLTLVKSYSVYDDFRYEYLMEEHAQTIRVKLRNYDAMHDYENVEEDINDFIRGTLIHYVEEVVDGTLLGFQGFFDYDYFIYMAVNHYFEMVCTAIENYLGEYVPPFNGSVEYTSFCSMNIETPFNESLNRFEVENIPPFIEFEDYFKRGTSAIENVYRFKEQLFGLVLLHYGLGGELPKETDVSRFYSEEHQLPLDEIGLLITKIAREFFQDVLSAITWLTTDVYDDLKNELKKGS